MATILRDEYVTINGVTVCIKAFQMASLSWLLDGPDWRDETDPLPGVAGQRSYTGIRDATKKVAPVHIDGNWKWDDSAHSNPRQGLIDNTAYLKANLGIGLTSVTLVWHQPSGATLSHAIKIHGPYGSKKLTPAFVPNTTFDVIFLDGDL